MVPADLVPALAAHRQFLEGRPNGQRLSMRGAMLTGTDLERQRLSMAMLAGSDLSRARLARSFLDGADLFGANLAGADLTDATLIGADLRGVNLAQARMHGANLERADLRAGQLVVWVSTRQVSRSHSADLAGEIGRASCRERV